MTQDCAQKALSKTILQNTWYKGKLPNRYRAKWAKGETGIGLDKHRATHMRLDEYRARQSLVGLSAHCANSYIPHACTAHYTVHMCCGM